MSTKGYSFKIDSGANSVVSVPHGRPTNHTVTLVTFTVSSEHPVSSDDIFTMAEVLLNALPKPKAVAKKELEQEQLLANLNKSLDEFEFSTRTANALEVAGIRAIKELVVKKETEMLGIINFGPRALRECKDILKSLGMHFGMKL